MGQIWSETVVPNSHFKPARDIPDLSGKVIIVTGGNTGIGKETVKQLLLKNAKTYLACRNRERAEAAIAELRELTGRNAIFLQLDLANLDSVTRSAKEFQSREAALHVLFNSAGVSVPPLDQFTDDGYDLQFGTNVLGPAHFTLMLMNELIAGAKSSPDGRARVVNTSSSSAYFSKRINYPAIMPGTPARRKAARFGLYSQSKFGNVLFSNELARRYAEHGILSNALNPGNLKTELLRHTPHLVTVIVNPFLYHASLGALTQLYVGTSPETLNDNGGWFIPWARRGKIGPAAKDPKLGTELWEWIEEQRKSHI